MAWSTQRQHDDAGLGMKWTKHGARMAGDSYTPEPPQSKPLSGPKTIAVKAALHRYGIGRTKLYELLAMGALKASKLGAKTLIDVEAADAFFGALPDFRERV
jgi:hypothetical protein